MVLSFDSIGVWLQSVHCRVQNGAEGVADWPHAIPTLNSTVATSLSVILNIGLLTTGRSVQTTGWKLELGATATPFVRSSANIAGELSACQRYYCTLPIGGTGATIVGPAFGAVASNSGYYYAVTYPVPMRSATVTPTVSNMQLVFGGTAAAVTAISSQLTNSPSNTGTTLILSTASTPAGAGSVYQVKQAASGGKFTFSAEL